MVKFGETLREHRTQPDWSYLDYEGLKELIKSTARHLRSQQLLQFTAPSLDGIPAGAARGYASPEAFALRVGAQLTAVSERYATELDRLREAVDGCGARRDLEGALVTLSELHRYVCVNYLGALKIGKKYDKRVRGLGSCRPLVLRELARQPFFAAMRVGLFGELEADIRMRGGEGAENSKEAYHQVSSSTPREPAVSSREPTEVEIELILGTMSSRYFPGKLPYPPRTLAPSPPGHARATAANLAVTYFAYASVMACRKALSVAKKPLEDELGVRATSLGILDTGMLLSYLAMQVAMSRWADRLALAPKWIMVISVGGSAVATLGAGWTYSVSTMMPWWVVNGLLQAMLYPQICLALNPWLEPHQRGRYMGVWNTAVPFGSLVSAGVSAVGLSARGWRGAFEGPAAAALVCAVLLALAFTQAEAAPREERASDDDTFVRRSGPGATVAEDDGTALQPPSAPPERATASVPHAPRLPPLPVWHLRLVRPVAAAYMVLKPIRYMFLFWGSYYQHKVLRLSLARAGAVELCGTVGGMAGGVLSGLLADRLFLGELFVPVALALAVALAAFPAVSAWGFASDVAIVTCTAALIGALDNIGSGLTGAAVVEVNEAEHGEAASIASVVAFVAASGSVGTILQGQLVTWIMDGHGWDSVFLLASTQALLGALILLLTVQRPTPAVGAAGPKRVKVD